MIMTGADIHNTAFHSVQLSGTIWNKDWWCGYLSHGAPSQCEGRQDSR